ncbi:glycosyltransferase [Photobacterium carnosum]|uniref:glycosyltransferase family 4 protein n=1 Tax=Photobacterium carnosum TaxID=2023717 RepID=UPI001E3C8AB3|nr:glycosyltransferase [Photobacterium carnosum]
MKILQVTTVATTLNAFLLPYATAFKALGWQVDAAAEGINDFPEVIAAHDNVYNIDFCRNPLKIKQLFSSVLQVRQLLKQNAYDVVHVHTPIAAFLTRLAAIGLSNTKVFYTAHGFHYINTNTKFKNFIFYLAEKIASFKTDHLFVINNEDYQFAVDKKIASRDQVTKIYGIGVDESLYQFNADARIQKRQQLDVDNEFVILQVAELNKNKNQQQVLHALAIVKQQQLTPFKYILAGIGSEKKALEQLVKDLNLTEDVQFLGFRKDVQDLISATDVVCLSSQREGLPRCIMEAMCAERPIIASNIRGCNDLLSSGCGELIQYNDTEAWVAGFTTLIQNPELRLTMGRKGLQEIKKNYTEKDVVSSVIDIYQRYV